MVKGTTIGVATDIDGKFSLEITETPGISLEFSFVGMNSKEIPVKIENGKVQPLRVVLEETETELDEVVVTGMFSRKKEGFTGSAVTVKGDELKKISTTSIAKALSTIEPSFRIMENISAGSDPNRLPDMRMRGSSTLPAGGAGDNKQIFFTFHRYFLFSSVSSAARPVMLSSGMPDSMTWSESMMSTACVRRP